MSKQPPRDTLTGESTDAERTGQSGSTSTRPRRSTSAVPSLLPLGAGAEFDRTLEVLSAADQEHARIARAAVAAMLDGESVPALALGEDLDVFHVNATVEAMIGRGLVEGPLHALDLTDAAEHESLTRNIRHAFEGSSNDVTFTMPTVGGARLKASFRPHVVHWSRGRSLTLRATQVQVLVRGQIASAFAGRTYEVALRGSSLVLVRDGSDARATTHDACHAVLAGRSTPCSNCPAFGAIHDGSATLAVTTTATPGGQHRLVRAVPIGENRARVESVDVDDAAVSRLLGARIDRVAFESGLSPRERAVLECLVLGRTLDDVAIMLGITRHTAKFHQANILEKLGADSRFDLLRILL